MKDNQKNRYRIAQKYVTKSRLMGMITNEVAAAQVTRN